MDKRFLGKTEDQIEALAAEVRIVMIALDAIATGAPISNFNDGYKRIGINFSLEACEIATDITGYDPTFCRMLNYKFRMDAAGLMFERACADVGSPLAA